MNILFSTIWNKITTEHVIKGNLYSDNQYETIEYGPLYQNTLSKFIGDKFSVQPKHGESGSILTFDKVEFGAYDEVYNHQAEGSDVKIEVELVNPIPEGTEGTEGSSDGYDYFEGQKENTNASPEPSEPSEPSAIVFIKCPQCTFESIHQDVIDHHIKYGHDLETR